MMETKRISMFLCFLVAMVFGAGVTAVQPALAGLQDDVDQAASIMERFQSIPEKEIPPGVLKRAHGLTQLRRRRNSPGLRRLRRCGLA